MTNNETKTGLEKLRDKISGALEDMRKYGKGKAQMDWGKGCEMAMEKCLANIDQAIDEEHAAMTKTPISCDKGLLEAIKNVAKAEPMLLKDGEMERARLISKGRLQIKEKLQKIIDRYIPQSCDKGLLNELIRYASCIEPTELADDIRNSLLELTAEYNYPDTSQFCDKWNELKIRVEQLRDTYFDHTSGHHACRVVLEWMDILSKDAPQLSPKQEDK